MKKNIVELNESQVEKIVNQIVKESIENIISEKYQTRPVGDWFRFYEYHPYMSPTIAILEVREKESDGSCKGCYFRRRCCSNERVKKIAGECSKTRRNDGKSVIFAKLGYQN